MRMRGLVAGVSALAVLAAGCGDGSGDATEEVSTVTLDLLDGAEAAGTARIALAFDGEQSAWMPGEVQRTTMDLEGVIDFEAGEHALSGEMVLTTVLPEGSVDEPTPPLRGSLALRQVDGTSYDRWSAEGDEGAPWHESDSYEEGSVEEGSGDESHAGTGGATETTVVVGDETGTSVVVEGEDEVVVEEDVDLGGETGELTPLDQLLSLEGGIDPAAVLDQIRDLASTFTEEGREDVRGATTTHYRAAVDRDDLGMIAMVFDAEPAVDVWVDDDGRLRRLDVGGARLELWDFGTAVDVEVPSPIGDPDDPEVDMGPFTGPTEAGEWTLAASGETSGRTWEVWAAPHDLRGVPVTCRTLEVDPGADDPFGGAGIEVEGFPSHGGVMAGCGYGSALFSLPTPDPSLQALVARDWSALDAPPLVAFVVDERWRDAPVQVVRDGAPEVELVPDGAGVAVWAPDGPASPTEIRLAGGEVVCDVITMAEQAEWAAQLVPGDDEDADWEDEMASQFPMLLTISGCVRP